MRAIFNGADLPLEAVDLAAQYESTQAMFDSGERIEQNAALATAVGIGMLVVSGAISIFNSGQRNCLSGVGIASGGLITIAGMRGLFRGNVIQDVAAQVDDAIYRVDILIAP